MNFKIRVVENIGRYSQDAFGKTGTVMQVTNGILTDFEGFQWGSHGITIRDIEGINKRLKHRSCDYKTVFELVEEEINDKE